MWCWPGCDTQQNLYCQPQLPNLSWAGNILGDIKHLRGPCAEKKRCVFADQWKWVVAIYLQLTAYWETGSGSPCEIIVSSPKGKSEWSTPILLSVLPPPSIGDITAPRGSVASSPGVNRAFLLQCLPFSLLSLPFPVVKTWSVALGHGSKGLAVAAVGAMREGPYIWQLLC